MERLFCENCNFHAKDNWDLNRHNATQRHLRVVRGVLEINQQCDYIFKDGHRCNQSCWGEKCKKHNTRAKERQKIYNEIKQSKNNKPTSKYQKNMFDKECQRKIKSCKRADELNAREINEDEYVSIEWIREELKRHENTCTYCGGNILIYCYGPDVTEQFIIHRADYKLPHHIDNCLISCLDCKLDEN